MDFFKSILSDDPNPETAPPDSPNSPPPPPNPNPNPSLWNFGTTFIKTLATKSESVIGTYRKDLEEFSSGLKMETSIIRHAASRAVENLSLDAAQESLESVGQAIDSIAEIIAKGKDTLLENVNDYDDEGSGSGSDGKLNYARSYDAKPYSRFDAQVRAMQSDMRTFLEEPEDAEEFGEWKLGFCLEDKVGEIEGLVSENWVVGEIFEEVVPEKVDERTFWARYFYKVFKLKKAEETRFMLVKKAIEGDDEEELSWDVDEDDYVESDGTKVVESQKDSREKTEDGSSSFKLDNDEKREVPEEMDGAGSTDLSRSVVEPEIKSVENELSEREVVSESLSGNNDNEKESLESNLEGRSDANASPEVKTDKDSDFSVVSGHLEGKSDEKASPEVKTDKDSDFSVVSSQPSPEDEYGWDEIEDLGSNEEGKVASASSRNSAELRKRLIAADEDEDLTWDIEDDD